MMAKRELLDYGRFVATVTELEYGDIPRYRQAPGATETEIGYWKHFQFTRAVNHARKGEATLEDYDYLARHGVYYPAIGENYRTPKFSE